MLKKTKRTQMNYINNRNSLINIEQLNMKVAETFWFGLVIGTLTGIVAVLYLTSDQSEKKEVN